MAKVRVQKKKCVVCRTKQRASAFYCLDCTRDWLRQPKQVFEPRWAVERALKIERARRKAEAGK